MLIIYYIDIKFHITIYQALRILLPMSFLGHKNDVKSISAKHLSSDYKISKMFMSKHYDLQKSLFGEIVFDDDFHKNKTTPCRMNDAYVCVYMSVCMNVHTYVCICVCFR
jgi:hypothetical protein